jgi:putative transposase
LITTHPIYNSLDITPAERQHAYRELFRFHLDDQQVHDIRSALNQELVLGRDDFKDKIEQLLKRQTRPAHPGRLCIKEQSAIYYA